MQDTKWHTIDGGIIRQERGGKEVAVLRLSGKNQDGELIGIQVTIEPERLERHFARTLDFAVRDLGLHGIL